MFFGDSSDKNNFPHKLLLTHTQVSKLRQAFVNGLSTNIKLSKTQFHEIGQSEGFLRGLLGPLLNAGMPLIGNVLKPLTKSVLIPLGLTAAASATYAAIHKKMFGSDHINYFEWRDGWYHESNEVSWRICVIDKKR